LPRPPACALGFSRPLGAFIRPVPAGLVSCRIRSWGCTLQSLPPLAQPHAVSGAVPLVSLDLSRILASRTPKRAPHETRELPRLQGFAPRESLPPNANGLGPRPAHGSHGLLPSRVFSLVAAARPSPCLPSWASSVNRKRSTAGPSGSRPPRGRLVSCETAGPPGLCRLLAITRVGLGPGSGVASSGFGVCHHPLASRP
jgi:hypothetical protein